jgi:radical SAM superfamily enzyme YgiQ (UPF0313 family)
MNKTRYKKLVLVKPPERYYWNFGAFSLGVLAAGVRHLVDVTVIDAGDMTAAQTLDSVWNLDPDLIGITLMGVPSVEPALGFLRLLNEQKSAAGVRAEKVPIIVGGHGAGMLPEEILNAGADCIVFGEGEATLRDIVENGVCPGMPGTAILKDGRMVKGPRRPLISPLDNLEPPARDLISPPKDGFHLMETSRGCPHHCEFCETTRFYGTRWRPHSPGRVVREVKRLLDEYDAYLIHFADDNFTANPKRVKKICRQLIDEEALPVYFTFFSRADDLISDPELMPLMAEAMMLRVNIGIDTLDPGVSENVSKTITTEVYRQTFDRMREVGMFSIGSLIIGLPGETEESRANAVERLVEAGPDFAQFMPYLPLPGLPRDERHTRFEPHPDDIRDAEAFTRDYLMHPTVKPRLEALVKKGGVQSRFALGVLKKIEENQPPMEQKT